MSAEDEGHVKAQRYDLITNYRCGSSIEEMEQADDGEWVRYEEVDAQILHLQEEQARLRHEWHLPTWTCGCGWRNGCNLAVCGACGRNPVEGQGVSDETQVEQFLTRALKAEEEQARLVKERDEWRALHHEAETKFVETHEELMEVESITCLETCICAAVKTKEGKIIRGHRHHDAMQAAHYAFWTPLRTEDAQGFITSHGRFVTREEGYQLQVAAGIGSVAPGGYRGERLFSEDLY